jgi:hypothetical protein
MITHSGQELKYRTERPPEKRTPVKRGQFGEAPKVSVNSSLFREDIFLKRTVWQGPHLSGKDNLARSTPFWSGQFG